MDSGEIAETERTSCSSVCRTRAPAFTAGIEPSRGSDSMASRTESWAAQETNTSDSSSSARSGDHVKKNAWSSGEFSVTTGACSMPSSSRNFGRLSTSV